MRERGLKHATSNRLKLKRAVAPHAGAWIETIHTSSKPTPGWVAPHAGAWIETKLSVEFGIYNMSLPMRERGLKLYHKAV